MLGDWLKNLVPVFNQAKARPKSIAPCTCNFSHTLSKLQANAAWFIRLFAPPLNGHSNYFAIGFSTVI